MNSISIKEFGRTPDGTVVSEYSLTNKHGIEMGVINYGCSITSLKVPDRNGQFDDVVLGFDSLNGYLSSPHFMGSVLGRYANRIAFGSFTLDGLDYSLSKNINPHHLHGGYKGFDKIVWTGLPFENENGVGIDFQYLSIDGEEGYPGNLNVHIRYFLNTAGEILIDYKATTDRKTIINLSQHSYFNLGGGKDNVLDHELKINADHFLPVDHSIIPTGEILPVEGTPFDFKKLKLIGCDIHADDIQIRTAGGYDHNWILNKPEGIFGHAATLFDSKSGRILEIYTTEPGLQLYTGNYLDALIKGKNNRDYGLHSGLCLETQHFPDSPHHPEFPSVVLRPGEIFHSTTVWKFSTN